MDKRMPVLFIGHGSPMNAVEDNEFTVSWRKAASGFPKPKAVLFVSAHWLTQGTAVTAMGKPRTIHDFYGFPDELYRIEYGCEGAPGLAQEISGMVSAVKVAKDSDWGLDHGAWVVARAMYPEADVPSLQLSIDYALPFSKHVAIGKQLAGLSQEGVLIIGSGNIVHNLGMLDWGGKPFPWAVDFDRFVGQAISEGAAGRLEEFRKEKDAGLAHPTYDHYLPLLYAAGAAHGRKPAFFGEGFFAGSLSMRCVRWD